MNIPQIIRLYINEVGKKFSPSIEIKAKSESNLMKLIGLIFFKINPNFMVRYYTTIGSTIFVPKEHFETANPIQTLQVIAHETTHVYQSKKYGSLIFSFLYLFPQILSLLTLLAFYNVWFLLFLLCLLPIPAYWRYQLELGGYRNALLFGKYVYKNTDYEYVKKQVVEQLTKSYYYFAWPFSNQIRKDLESFSFINEEPYKSTLEFIQRNKVTS